VDHNVQFHIGEVISVPESATYEYVAENQFEVFVKTYTNYFDQQIVRAIPFNVNTKQIPLIGEHVLLVSGLTPDNTADTQYVKWYYVSSFSLNSSVNANLLQGVSTVDVADTQELSFQEKEISALQPFQGDSIIEGRFGNSIRLSSTVKGGQYSIRPSWDGSQNGDPIIILSNGRSYKKDAYIIETIGNDASSLYLTSTQQINSFNLTKNLTVHNGPFNGAQFIGIADRVILRAKRDIAVIDSQDGIVLNTPNEIYIGGEDASEPISHGLVLQQILQLLVQSIAAGTTGPGGAPGVTNAAPLLSQIQRLLLTLNSKKYKITKT
jgi:hypothetical protein